MANVAKVAMVFRRGDVEDVVVTFHVRAVDSRAPFDDDDLGQMVGAVEAWWDVDEWGDPDIGVRHRNLCDADTELLRVQAHRVKPTVGAVLEAPEPLGAGADLLVPKLPPQCAFVVGLRTTLDDRRGRGRMYWLPFDIGDLDYDGPRGFIGDDGTEAIGQQAARLADAIRVYSLEDPPWTLAVYSRVDGDAHPVTHFMIPNRVATQRRRRFEPPDFRSVGLSGIPD